MAVSFASSTIETPNAPAIAFSVPQEGFEIPRSSCDGVPVVIPATAQEVDRYKAAKVREREEEQIGRPLSNRTINKTLTRLGQILDAAVRYDLIDYNPVKTKVEKLKEAEPKRARLTGEQVQALLRAAGPHRTLLATAIMAGGLRVSELTHLHWRDLDLRQGVLNVAASKTPPRLYRRDRDEAPDSARWPARRVRLGRNGQKRGLGLRRGGQDSRSG